MATFYKIKAKQRRELQRAIMRSIQQYGLVDTYSMKDSVRVMTDSRVTFSGIYIKVTALFYFRFHDTFASNGYSTSRGVDPVPIINTAFSSSKAQQTFADIASLYLEFLDDTNLLFDAIDEGKFKANLPIYVGFEFYGSDDSRWNKAVAFDKWSSITID